MVRHRLIAVLLLMVVAPLVLMAWLAMRVARTEQLQLQQTHRRLLADQLGGFERRIVELLQERQRQLTDQIDPSNTNAEQIRALVETLPILRQVLVLRPSGARVHPPDLALCSEDERSFVQRARQLLDEHATLGLSERSSGSMASRSGSGWYGWFWDSGLNLAIWQRAATGHFVAFELDRHRLLADIVGVLPDAIEAPRGLQRRRVALLDTRGMPIYQWGGYKPPDGANPTVSVRLTAPLRAWRLQSFVHPDFLPESVGRSAWLNMVAATVLVGLALLALGIYLYRESTRSARDARQRVSFVNQVSHELKTPLTNIRMYSELLQERLGGQDTTTDRHLGVVVAECERLSRLIENVLSFARQQRGALKLRRNPAVVDEIVAQVVEAFRPALSGKGVQLSFAAGAPQPVSIDADVLRQIVTNLLSNIEKYAAGSGPVTVESQQQANRITLTITDSGPGIAERDAKRIFAPFVRLGSRVDEGVAGTGIGLSISRELARLHGGDLVLADRSERPSADTSSGAAFVLTLTAIAAQAQIEER